MIVDYLLELASKQELTAATGSTNAADFEQDEPTTGLDCQEVVMIFQVAEDVSGTLQFEIQDADTNDEAQYATAVAGPVLTDPVAGTQVVVKMPYKHKRFVRAYFGGEPTAGKVNALITSGFTQNEPFKVLQSYKDSRPDLPAPLGPDITYVTKADADKNYLGKTEKAASAAVADSANALKAGVKVDAATRADSAASADSLKEGVKVAAAERADSAASADALKAGVKVAAAERADSAASADALKAGVKVDSAASADTAKGLATGTKVDLTSQVQGVLPVANGGTGKATS